MKKEPFLEAIASMTKLADELDKLLTEPVDECDGCNEWNEIQREFAKGIASNNKALLDAHMEAGFTRDEAFALVLTMIDNN